MARFNRNYDSLLIFLKKEVFLKKGERAVNAPDYLSADGYSYVYEAELTDSQFERQFRGPVQPLADMAKDVMDTFKPYKGWYQFRRELMQPLRGAGNLVIAAITLIGAPLVFIASTMVYIFKPSTFLKNMRKNFINTTAWLLDAITTGIRGGSQIVTTPLLVPRMGLRGILTLFHQPKIEENKGIHRLVEKANASKENMYHITLAIHIKFINAHRKGQVTSIDPTAEDKVYTPLTQSDVGNQQYNAYLSLFKPAVPQNNQANIPIHNNKPKQA